MVHNTWCTFFCEIGILQFIFSKWSGTLRLLCWNILSQVGPNHQYNSPKWTIRELGTENTNSPKEYLMLIIAVTFCRLYHYGWNPYLVPQEIPLHPLLPSPPQSCTYPTCVAGQIGLFQTNKIKNLLTTLKIAFLSVILVLWWKCVWPNKCDGMKFNCTYSLVNFYWVLLISCNFILKCCHQIVSDRGCLKCKWRLRSLIILGISSFEGIVVQPHLLCSPQVAMLWPSYFTQMEVLPTTDSPATMWLWIARLVRK